MNSQERQELIAQYKDGFNVVARSLRGINAESLTAHPIAGKWSAAEIVHHLLLIDDLLHRKSAIILAVEVNDVLVELGHGGCVQRERV